jgi:hypothetical protein
MRPHRNDLCGRIDQKAGKNSFFFLIFAESSNVGRTLVKSKYYHILINLDVFYAIV